MEQQKIDQIELAIKKDCSNIAGIIIQKSGVRQYESYYNDYDAEKPIHVFSVTKSVFCTLIGIAIDKGLISGVNQKILEFFPDYKVKKNETTIQKITIKDMLTMTAPYKYKKEPYKKFFRSKNWLECALDLLGGKDKIGEFTYSAIIGLHVLSAILSKAVGESVYEFANRNLFSPLGINVEKNYVLENKKQQMDFYKSKYISCWVADKQGINTASWGLTLTPTDMVKIGQLYLDKGKWKDNQIVSSQWINDCTKVHSNWGELSYGYLWWIIDNKDKIYTAIGDGGNVIYINTSKKLVISITSLFLPNITDRVDFIRKYIEPAF